MRRLSNIILNQHPVTAHSDTFVKDACKRMREARVGSVLVTDPDGVLVGIFTGRDAVNRVIAAGRNPATTRLTDVMTPNPSTMPPDKTAIDALRLMWEGGFRHVPVIREGHVVGIVSRSDFKGHEQDRLEEERELWEHMR
jgi:CBS domain-containing protein